MKAQVSALIRVREKAACGYLGRRDTPIAAAGTAPGVASLGVVTARWRPVRTVGHDVQYAW